MAKGIPKNGTNAGWIKKGQKLSEVTRARMSKAHKGKPMAHGFTKTVRKNMSLGARRRIENNLGDRVWRGNRNEYYRIHYKVRKKFGVPNICEICNIKGEGREMQWANLKGNWEIVRENWARMCKACHYKYDHGNEQKKR